ncbi:N-acetylglucosaminyl-phosphatidylinositol de-N-acetylase [Verticillium nonalfalfae]|uniref:N-acetylglucosaminylphosphatidylinositol deacetylase n=1 Tax=Verticillium nonalfalfae TaxID=1051616 RepID=A0A3M9YGE0_9PEZI|nr:N-acetylglucosaminyl-phosphatidylinositol de-N-acetylase [Verticillium nonalfalfae]RNJ59637.1 N-acetylglucosaminyl-phosphatidylinositol de-N-acetylase [Verticillium nonalfalfae]
MAWLWVLSAASAALAALLPLFYIYAATTLQAGLPRLTNKRICLLIAHPDDEAMFFAPTVLALTRPETGNHVKILCLSAGDADGLGETRKKELVKSGMALGLRQEDDVFVVDSPDFQDSMTLTWDAHKIASLLCSAFAPPAGLPTSAAAAAASIDVLVTFDAAGVSSHPNHISLHAGARAFLAQLLRARPGRPAPVALYTLTSVSLLRKYAAVADALPTLLGWYLGGGRAEVDEQRGQNEDHDQDQDQDRPHPKTLLFFNQLTGDGGLPTAWKAMTTAHRSQMVWFRYAWIVLSRYMVINDLALAEVVDEPPVSLGAADAAGRGDVAGAEEEAP